MDDTELKRKIENHGKLILATLSVSAISLVVISICVLNHLFFNGPDTSAGGTGVKLVVVPTENAKPEASTLVGKSDEEAVAISVKDVSRKQRVYQLYLQAKAQYEKWPSFLFADQERRASESGRDREVVTIYLGGTDGFAKIDEYSCQSGAWFPSKIFSNDTNGFLTVACSNSAGPLIGGSDDTCSVTIYIRFFETNFEFETGFSCEGPLCDTSVHSVLFDPESRLMRVSVYTAGGLFRPYGLTEHDLQVDYMPDPVPITVFELQFDELWNMSSFKRIEM